MAFKKKGVKTHGAFETQVVSLMATQRKDFGFSLLDEGW